MTISLVNCTSVPMQAIVDAIDVTRGKTNCHYTSEDCAKKILNVAKLGHWSVFEHASFTFYLEGISRVTQQQLTRHRMTSFSIESQRHVRLDGETKDAFVIPDTVVKRQATDIWDEAIIVTRLAYDKLIEAGVPIEDARYILPEASTGNILMTMNARELYHFFKLRMAPSAQWEIRKLANLMFSLLKENFSEIFNDDVLRYAE